MNDGQIGFSSDGLEGGDQSWLDGPGHAPVSDEGGGSGVWFLLLAAAGLAISAVALVGGVGAQVLGYLSASLLLFTSVAWFRRRSLERQAREGIATARTLNMLAIALLVSGFALSVVHAWHIASHLS
jgi:hypothetical protein